MACKTQNIKYYTNVINGILGFVLWMIYKTLILYCIIAIKVSVKNLVLSQKVFVIVKTKVDALDLALRPCLHNSGYYLLLQNHKIYLLEDKP